METPDSSLNMMEVEGNHRGVNMEIRSSHRPSQNFAILPKAMKRLKLNGDDLNKRAIHKRGRFETIREIWMYLIRIILKKFKELGKLLRG